MPHHEYEAYQAFMLGYVKRINDATLRVPFGGIRIGQAKYSRLAQINLRTRIITFSRFAIENVPERGRRYLVIHELAHVKEASHNKNFWQLVAAHEPRYKEIGKELEIAFHQNVRAERYKASPDKIYQARLFPSVKADNWHEFKDSLSQIPEFSQLRLDLESGKEAGSLQEQNFDPGLIYPQDSGLNFNCSSDSISCDDVLLHRPDNDSGIISGGFDQPDAADDYYLDDYYLDHI